MPRTKVIAKKDCQPYFKIGDELTIVPVLYEEDTLIVNEVYGLFDDHGKMLMIAEKNDLIRFKHNIKKIGEKVFAPKGSCKTHYIETQDGRQYPSSIVRNFEDFFDKI